MPVAAEHSGPQTEGERSTERERGRRKSIDFREREGKRTETEIE